ncbi:hypothetical protein EYF80_058449 [Liparis tanakae]|uniref:Uncharacterized protein n=1 Tax=Liparis tanakae TaxID=230148 RepID=A0A4Z2ERI5_9TELE|nr:hypothetical protein EYF80_058449 [Liparis tanakae]
MWTTAGAIFSTTSAMKLNLYRGLLALEGPTLARRIMYFNKQSEPEYRRSPGTDGFGVSGTRRITCRTSVDRLDLGIKARPKRSPPLSEQRSGSEDTGPWEEPFPWTLELL